MNKSYNVRIRVLGHGLDGDRWQLFTETLKPFIQVLTWNEVSFVEDLEIKNKAILISSVKLGQGALANGTARSAL